MRKSFSVLCLLVLMVGGLIGCTAPDKQDTAQTSAAKAGPTSAGTPYQYRAVCIEKEAHGGNEQVLSTWLDSRDEANKLAQYHGDFKEKGHRWRIDERVKPE